MIIDPAAAQTPKPPVRRGLLHVVSMALVVGALVSISIDMLVGLVGGWPWFSAMLLILAAGLAGQLLPRTGRARTGVGSLLSLFATGYLALLILPVLAGRQSALTALSAIAWFGVLVLVMGWFLGQRGALSASIAGLGILVPIFALSEWDAGSLTLVEILIIGVATAVFAYLLNYTLRRTVESYDLVRAARDELEQTRIALQRQLEERTQVLALAAAVGRQITRIQSLDTMLADAVDLIYDQFQLYHVQVYLLGPTTQELILHAATGQAGAELLQQGHRLPIGPGSINGAAAAGRQPIIVSDARQSSLFLPNTLLPETQSEISIPMIFEDNVIGTLDLQSAMPDGLGIANLEAFSLLAAQLATAVENARLFTEITQTREQLSRQAQAQTRDSWSRFIAERPVEPFVIDSPPTVETTAVVRQAIPVHGTPIGYLEMGQATANSPRARELVAAVAGQLGAHLENLRLTQQAEEALLEAQQREEELALINRIVSAIAASTDLTTSLQLVVNQLAVATSIQQVGIAILNEERTGLTVVADRSGSLNTDSAVGFFIPVENNPATQMAIAERRPIVVPQATENPLTASAHDVLRQRGVKTILILPLVVENEVIGTVGLDVVEEGIELTDDQLRLAETIIYQAATAIQRARLFNQTEEARRDAEQLFTLSAALNAAQTAPDIVGAIVNSGLAETPSLVSLSVVDSDEDRRPRWSTVAATWSDPIHHDTTGSYRPGERFHLPDIDIDGAWAAGRSEPILIEDAGVDERVTGMLRALYESMEVGAAVLLPLRVRDSWVGLVELSWSEPRRFTIHDRRIFQSMATQLAVTLSNQQLVEEVRTRSRQLEILSRVEAGLSLATTEDEILLSLASGVPWSEPPDLELVYLSAQPDGAWLAERAGRVRDGQAEPLTDAKPWPLELMRLSALWLEKPRELLIIGSAQRDNRLDQTMRAEMAREGRRAAVVMPLRRAGRWQGVLTLGWPDSHELTADEAFILRRLHEPLAATVAGRRAYLAQQAALARTEAALAAQARLSAELRAVSDVSLATAATLDVDRLLAAAADLTKENFDLYHSHIYLLDDDKSVLTLRAGAGEIGRQMAREGRQIPISARSIVARAARERDVILVRDTRRSTDFLPHILLPDTRSEMAIPLIIGDRLLGVLDVQSDEVGRFRPDDRQVYKILAAQLTVATQNALYFAEQLEMAEKLREVDRLKTDFLARMSHELRTPLNSIIGFADVLLMGLDGDLTERMIEDLQLIRGGGYHLRDIIGDILDMSKIEAGRLELIYEEFDVRRVATELMATAASLADQKGLNLRLDIADGIAPLTADRTRIRQVLWNIIGNAIKFTDHGGIIVSIQPDGDNLLFCVADTGIGITPENQARIFEYFSQIDAGRRESISGTGLGLSISKSLVEYHGGRIWVESQLGGGSTFRFTIPARPDEAAEALDAVL
jgi:signal transduction histidine kinase